MKPIFCAVVPQPMTNSSWEDEDELQTPTVEEQNFPDSKVSQLQYPSKVTHQYLLQQEKEIHSIYFHPSLQNHPMHLLLLIATRKI